LYRLFFIMIHKTGRDCIIKPLHFVNNAFF